MFTVGLRCLSLLWMSQIQASGHEEIVAGVKGKGLSDSPIHLSHVAFAFFLSLPRPPPELPVLPAASGDSIVQFRALFPAIWQVRHTGSGFFILCLSYRGKGYYIHSCNCLRGSRKEGRASFTCLHSAGQRRWL